MKDKSLQDYDSKINDHLYELVDHLKEISKERRNQAIGIQGVANGIAEWNFGYSEALEYVIKKIELLIR